MNLIKITLLLFILFTTNILYSQQFYQKAIGGLNDETFRAVKQTSDGGFIFAGNTLSFGSGNLDFYIIKTDINGDTLWTKTYGDASYDDCFDIDELTGGGYIIVGESNSFGTSGYEIFLINIDANGNVLWSKIYGGAGSDKGIRVRQTSDLGFIIGGITFSYGNNAQFYLIKTDANGNVLWTNILGGINYEYLYGLDITSDGGFILVGQTASYGAGGDDVFVVKTDSLGNEQWSASYGMAGSEYGYFIEETSDGGYIITGTTNSAGAGSWDVLLIKLNSVGNLSWTKTFGSASSDRGWEIHETNDNGFIVINQAYNLGYGLTDAMIIKTDNNGNLDWAKVFGGTQNDYFLAGCITTDNGLMLAGKTNSFGSGNYDNYFVRTDSLGFAYNCYSVDITLTVNSPAFIQNAPVLLTNTGVTENTVVAIEMPTNSIIDDICPCYFNHTLTVTDALCFGDSNGSANISVSGGTIPYNFSWSTTSNNDTIENLIAGDYYVIVSDMYGCTASDTAYVLQPLQLTDTFNVFNVNCFGGSDGSAIVNIGGGTSPYGYLWSDLGTSDTLSNASAGMYYITVVDDHLCVLIDSVEITEPTELFIDSISQTDVLCFGDSTGTAQIYDSGGTIPYYYNWSNGDTIANAQNMPYGWFYVTLTDDNACTKTDSIFINQPNALVDSLLTHNVSCFGDSNGTAISIPSGGVMPYTYLWSNSNTNDTISNLYPGTFYLTITDNNLCTYIDTAVITEPPLLEVLITHNNVTCFGFNNGDATSIASGGTFPYIYQWSNGDTTNITQDLIAGTYYLIVYDTNACVVSDSITIEQPDLLLDSLQHTNISCYNGSDGDALVNAYGGTSPYTYLWSNGDTVDYINGVIAGLYYVTITDTNNCVTVDSIDITEPSQLLVADSAVDVLCYGDTTGMIFLNVSGGTSPYYYNWFNSSTDSYITGLPVGTYAVTIIDDNGCIFQIPKIDVDQPDLLVVYLDYTMPLCYDFSDGIVNSYVSGGIEPYSYLWADGETGSVLTNIASNNYFLTVTDYNACTAADTIFVTQPELLTLSDSIYITNFFGNIDLTTNGGTFPYNYLWSNNETTENINELISGTYQVTVNDFNNCEIIGIYTIDIPFNIPTLITPNGDGYNDNWQITNLNYYPDISIEIFNRWGDIVFKFTGSGFEYDNNRWDGTYEGKELPMSGYVYILDLKNGIEPYNGVVTIKR